MAKRDRNERKSDPRPPDEEARAERERLRDGLGDAARAGDPAADDGRNEPGHGSAGAKGPGGKSGGGGR